MTIADPPTVMTPVPRFDRRVVNEDGKPVPQFRPRWSRGWFVISRADGPDGVELEARIPGYLMGQVTPHPDQETAELAARGIWREYAAATATATGRPLKEQETEPWAS